MAATKTAGANGQAKGAAETLVNVTKAGEQVFFDLAPYAIEVEVTGVCPILFHRWNDEAVVAKSQAARGSTARKTDDVESYVWRMKEGDPKSDIAVPGEYLRMAIVKASGYTRDPRAPRRAGTDLYKAGVAVLTERASIGKNHWDYLDRRRATVQRAGITRVRPAFMDGWKAKFLLQVNLPEFIGEQDLYAILTVAGKAVGLGDFRPQYGRFAITSWKVL